MSTATISTKGQLVIPGRIRNALHLQPGDKVILTLEGEKLILQRYTPRRAKLVEKHGRRILIAPPDAPHMTTKAVKALLAEFP